MNFIYTAQGEFKMFSRSYVEHMDWKELDRKKIENIKNIYEMKVKNIDEKVRSLKKERINKYRPFTEIEEDIFRRLIQESIDEKKNAKTNSDKQIDKVCDERRNAKTNSDKQIDKVCDERRSRK